MEDPPAEEGAAVRDLTDDLYRLMHQAGYVQKTTANNGWGNVTCWYDKEGDFVSYPPGSIRFTSGQANLKKANGSWMVWITKGSGAVQKVSQQELLSLQRQEIALCRDNPPEYDQSALWRQMQPLVKLVGEHATELLNDDRVSV